MKKLEHTYIGPDKTPNVLPGYMYKSLQILINNEQKDDNEVSPQKKKCLENKNILQNCVFQQNQYIKSEKTIKTCQELTSQSTSAKFKRNKGILFSVLYFFTDSFFIYLHLNYFYLYLRK